MEARRVGEGATLKKSTRYVKHFEAVSLLLLDPVGKINQASRMVEKQPCSHPQSVKEPRRA